MLILRTLLAAILASAPFVPLLRGQQAAAPFAVDAKDLLAQAKLVSDKSADVVVLLEETKEMFAADAKLHQTYRLIFAVQNQQGVDDWSTVQENWEPWHEKRPVFEARIITPDGAIHQLDPRTVTDGPAKQGASDTFSDARVVKCPLPALVPGAVVEEQITTDETQPAFAAGSLKRVFFGRMSTRVVASVLTVDYPNSVPLQYEARKLPALKVEKTSTADRTHIQFRMDGLDPLASLPPLLPSSVVYWPSIVLSTGESWPAVARAYNALVEAKLAGTKIGKFADQAVAGKTDREAKISALLRALQKQVRYTGIEFSEAAIIPVKPDEAWEHKYGDCKDKATLLVAMLRAEGIPAYVALLSTGPGMDVDEKHAGFGLFDHAIVYVPGVAAGERSLWIDATDQFGQLGALPSADQGRMALVISDDCKGLTKTAELHAGDSTYMETREFFLPEIGPAKVVEISEATGNADSYQRAEYGFQETPDSKKNLTDYMHREYIGKGAVEISHPGGDDFSRPFQLRLELPDGKRGLVDETGAYVYIDLSAIANRLPSALTKSLDPAEKEERKEDYELPEAFVTNWHYRIHLPAGYQMKGLPDVVDRDLGPAHFSAHYRTSSGLVEADYAFTLDHRVISAEQGTSLRKAVNEFRNQSNVQLVFLPQGRVYLQGGKVSEGLAAFDSACKKNPAAALPHVQYAMALIEEGMGEAARAQALTATKLDPKLVSAWRTQGFVLLNDLIGRQFSPGFDFAGAEQSLRKALALDSKDTTAERNLAILLEYDANGQRYVSKPRLEEAIKVYRGMGDDLQSEGLTNNLLYALAYAGHFAEVKTETGKLAPSQVPTALRLVAISQLDSSAAAIAEGESLLGNSSVRSASLETASLILLTMQKYEAAADLLTAAANGSKNASELTARAALYRKIKPFDIHSLRPDSPEHAVMLFTLSAFSPDVSLADFTSLLSTDTRAFYSPAELKLSAGRVRDSSRSYVARSGISARAFTDLIASLIQTKADPNGTDGARVHLTSLGSKPQSSYVTREGGSFKILEFEDSISPVAYHAFRLAAAGSDEAHLASARQFLDWLRESVKPAGGDDPLASAPFSHLWTKGQKGTQAEIEVAAASLALSQHAAPEMLPVLQRALSAKTQMSPDGALESAYVRTAIQVDEAAAAKAEPVARKLTETFPSSAEAAALYMQVLMKQNKLAEAENAAIMFTKAAEGDEPAVTNWLINCYEAEKRFKDSAALALKLSSGEKATAMSYNLMGWDAVLAHAVPPETLEAVQHAATSNANNAPLLHTLAMMYAEVGKGREARSMAAQAMANWGLTEPNSEIWLIYGRIAEDYGLTEEARSAYRKVEPPTYKALIPDSTSFAIAQERLKLLAQPRRTPIN